ncbi:cytochrome c [Bosea sp. BK604]|uniref:c-type cytochrome n=1 Tax=Bosea sp. BK604 TaxID=2512180 RepID=UPI0010480C29|nr:cytochrome c [Bosea sp. BK604]
MMTHARNRLCAGLAILLAFTVAPLSAQQEQRTMSRGEYLSRIMDCGGCHTPGALAGKPDEARKLAGSQIGFQIPGLGTFYPPNLTPDKQTGLGNWSEAEIIRAVRTGVRPDGRMLAPAMPWMSYAALNDTDARDLARYLKGLKPVELAAPPLTGADKPPPAPYFTVVVPKP